ncbi:MAG: hypothetical protein MHPSP_004513, partial [Paramarteilia canceri]
MLWSQQFLRFSLRTFCKETSKVARGAKPSQISTEKSLKSHWSGQLFGVPSSNGGRKKFKLNVGDLLLAIFTPYVGFRLIWSFKEGMNRKIVDLDKFCEEYLSEGM